MEEFNNLLKAQAKERKERIKDMKKIIEDALHKLNRLNDPHHAAIGPKEGLRLTLSNAIKELNN